MEKEMKDPMSENRKIDKLSCDVIIPRFQDKYPALTATDCLINGLYPDSTNCNRFYMCAVNGPVLFQCPAGLHFNPILDYCDWPETAECTLSASQTEVTFISDIATKTTITPPISATSKEASAISDHQLSDNNATPEVGLSSNQTASSVKLLTESVSNTEASIYNTTVSGTGKLLGSTPYTNASAAVESSTVSASETVIVNVSTDSVLATPTGGAPILNLTTENSPALIQTVPTVVPIVSHTTLSTNNQIGVLENSTTSEIETPATTSAITITDGQNSITILDPASNTTSTNEKPFGSQALNGLPETPTNLYTTISNKLSTAVKTTDNVVTVDTSNKPFVSTTVSVIELENTTVAAILEASLETIVPTSEKTASTEIPPAVPAAGIENLLDSTTYVNASAAVANLTTSEPGAAVASNVSLDSSSVTPSSGIPLLNLTANTINSTPSVIPAAVGAASDGLSSIIQQTLIPEKSTIFETGALVNTSSTDSLAAENFADSEPRTDITVNNSTASSLVTSSSVFPVLNLTAIETNSDSAQATLRATTSIPEATSGGFSTTNKQILIPENTTAIATGILANTSSTITSNVQKNNITTSIPVFNTSSVTTIEPGIFVNTSDISSPTAEQNKISTWVSAFNTTSSSTTAKSFGTEGLNEFPQVVTNVNTVTPSNELSTTVNVISNSEPVDSSNKAAVSTIAPVIEPDSTTLVKLETLLETTVSTNEQFFSTATQHMASKDNTTLNNSYSVGSTATENFTSVESLINVDAVSVSELLSSIPPTNMPVAVEKFSAPKYGTNTAVNVSTASTLLTSTSGVLILNSTANTTSSTAGHTVIENSPTTPTTTPKETDTSSTSGQTVSTASTLLTVSNGVTTLTLTADETSSAPGQTAIATTRQTETNSSQGQSVLTASTLIPATSGVSTLNLIANENATTSGQTVIETSSTPGQTDTNSSQGQSVLTASTLIPATSGVSTLNLIANENATTSGQTVIETSSTPGQTDTNSYPGQLVSTVSALIPSTSEVSYSGQSVSTVSTLIPSTSEVSTLNLKGNGTSRTPGQTVIEANSTPGQTQTSPAPGQNISTASTLIPSPSEVPTLNLIADKTSATSGQTVIETSYSPGQTEINSSLGQSASPASTLTPSTSEVPSLNLIANKTNSTSGQTVIETSSTPGQTDTNSYPGQSIPTASTLIPSSSEVSTLNLKANETSPTPGQTVIETSSTPRQTETSSASGQNVSTASTLITSTNGVSVLTLTANEASPTPEQTVIEANSTLGQTQTSPTPGHNISTASTLISSPSEVPTLNLIADKTSATSGQTVIETSYTPGQTEINSSLGQSVSTTSISILSTSEVPTLNLKGNGPSHTPGQTVIETSSTPRQTETSSAPGQNVSTASTLITSTNGVPVLTLTANETSPTPEQTVIEGNSTFGQTQTTPTPGQNISTASTLIPSTSEVSTLNLIADEDETSATSGQTVMEISSTPGQTDTDTSLVETVSTASTLIPSTSVVSTLNLIPNKTSSTPGQTVIETSSTPGETETNLYPGQSVSTVSTLIPSPSEAPTLNVIANETSSTPGQTVIESNSTQGQTESNSSPRQSVSTASTLIASTNGVPILNLTANETSSTAGSTIIESDSTPGQTETTSTSGQIVSTVSVLLTSTSGALTLNLTTNETSSTSGQTVIATSSTPGQTDGNSYPGQSVSTASTLKPSTSEVPTLNLEGNGTSSTPRQTETSSTPGQNVSTASTLITSINGVPVLNLTANETSSTSGPRVVETSSTQGQTETTSTSGQSVSTASTLIPSTTEALTLNLIANETSPTPGQTVIATGSTPELTKTSSTPGQDVFPASTLITSTNEVTTLNLTANETSSMSGIVIETSSTPGKTDTSFIPGQIVSIASTLITSTNGVPTLNLATNATSSTPEQTVIETSSTPGQTNTSFSPEQVVSTPSTLITSTNEVTTLNLTANETDFTSSQIVITISSTAQPTKTSSTPEQSVFPASTLITSTNGVPTLDLTASETSSIPEQTDIEISSTPGPTKTSLTPKPNVTTTSTVVTPINEVTANEASSTAGQAVVDISSTRGQSEASFTPGQKVSTASTLVTSTGVPTLNLTAAETSSTPGQTVTETSSTPGPTKASSTPGQSVFPGSTLITSTNEVTTLGLTANETSSTPAQTASSVVPIALETASGELSFIDKQTLTQTNSIIETEIPSNIPSTDISTAEQSNVTISVLGTSPVPISEKSPSTEEITRYPENPTSFNSTISNELPTTVRVTGNFEAANHTNKVSLFTTTPVTVSKESIITYDEAFVTREVTAASDKPSTLETEVAESIAPSATIDPTTVINVYANSAAGLTSNEIISSSIGQSQVSLGTVTKVNDVMHKSETVTSDSSNFYEEVVPSSDKTSVSEIPTTATKSNAISVLEELTVSLKPEATYNDALFTTSTVKIDVATTPELGITTNDAEFRTLTTNEEISSSKSADTSVSFATSPTETINDGSLSTIDQGVILKNSTNSATNVTIKDQLPPGTPTTAVYAPSETGLTTNKEVSSTLELTKLPTVSASLELEVNSDDGLRSTSSQTIIQETSTTVDLIVSTVSSNEAFKTATPNIFPDTYATTDANVYATPESNTLNTGDVSEIGLIINEEVSFSMPTEMATSVTNFDSEPRVSDVTLATSTRFELGLSTGNNISTEVPFNVLTNNTFSEFLHNKSSTVPDKDFTASGTKAETSTIADTKAEPVHIEPSTTAPPKLTSAENSFTVHETQPDEFTTRKSNEISDGSSIFEIKAATINTILSTERPVLTSLASMEPFTDDVILSNTESAISSDAQTIANTQSSFTPESTLDVLGSQETTKKSDLMVPDVEVQNKTSPKESNVKEEVATHSGLGTTSNKIFTFIGGSTIVPEDTTTSKTRTTDESNTVPTIVQESPTNSTMLLSTSKLSSVLEVSSTPKIGTSTSGSLKTDTVINNEFSSVQNEKTSLEPVVISETEIFTVPTAKPSALNSLTEFVTHDEEKDSTTQPTTALNSSSISQILNNEIVSEPEETLSTTEWLFSTKVIITKPDGAENLETLTTDNTNIVSSNIPNKIDNTVASETDKSDNAVSSSTQPITRDEIPPTIYAELEKSSNEHILSTETPNKLPANSTVLSTPTNAPSVVTDSIGESFSFAKEVTKMVTLTIGDETVLTSQVTTKSSIPEIPNRPSSSKILEITTEKVPQETSSVLPVVAKVNATSAPNYTTFLGIETSDEISADKSKENDENNKIYEDISNNDDRSYNNDHDYEQNNSAEADDYGNTFEGDEANDDDNNDDNVAENENGDNNDDDANTDDGDIVHYDSSDNNYEDKEGEKHKYYGVHFKEGSDKEISSEKTSKEDKNSTEKSSTEDGGHKNKYKHKHGKDSEEDKDDKYKDKHKYDKDSGETSKEHSNSDHKHNHHGKDCKEDASKENEHNKDKNNKNDENYHRDGSIEVSSREEQRNNDKNNKSNHKHHGRNGSKEESSKEDQRNTIKDSKYDHKDNRNDSKESSIEEQHNKNKNSKNNHKYHGNDSKEDKYDKDKNKHHYNKHSRENYSKENKHDHKHNDRSREKSTEVKTDVSSSENRFKHFIKENKHLDLENRYYVNKKNKGYVVDLETFYKEIRKFRKTLRVF